MSTAIVRIYTEEGFVIAADGRQVREDGLPFNDGAQKIFPLCDERGSLAYAICGTTLMTSDDDTNEPVWDLAAEMAHAIKSLSGRKSKNLFGYATRLSRPINRHLKEAKQNGNIAKYPTETDMIDHDGSMIAEALIDGYYNGVPSRVSIKLYHRSQQLAEPEVFRDSIPTGSYVIHGSKLISESFRNPADRRFADYGQLAWTNSPVTLSEAIKVSEGYIRACSSPEAIQMDAKCAGIGGHIHIATITPKDGFRWVPGYEPI
jgi:hypothetical protein